MPCCFATCAKITTCNTYIFYLNLNETLANKPSGYFEPSLKTASSSSCRLLIPLVLCFQAAVYIRRKKQEKRTVKNLYPNIPGMCGNTNTDMPLSKHTEMCLDAALTILSQTIQSPAARTHLEKSFPDSAFAQDPESAQKYLLQLSTDAQNRARENILAWMSENRLFESMQILDEQALHKALPKANETQLPPPKQFLPKQVLSDVKTSCEKTELENLQLLLAKKKAAVSEMTIQVQNIVRETSALCENIATLSPTHDPSHLHTPSDQTHHKINT